VGVGATVVGLSVVGLSVVGFSVVAASVLVVWGAVVVGVSVVLATVVLSAGGSVGVAGSAVVAVGFSGFMEDCAKAVAQNRVHRRAMCLN